MNMLMQAGQTALMYAAISGDKEIIDLLLEHDAAVMEQDNVSFISKSVIGLLQIAVVHVLASGFVSQCVCVLCVYCASLCCNWVLLDVALCVSMDRLFLYSYINCMMNT